MSHQNNPISSQFTELYIQAPGDLRKSLSLNLSTGNIIKALVLENLPDKKVLLKINGQKIVANSLVSLSKGELVDLQVKSTSPQVILNHVVNNDVNSTKDEKLLSFFRERIPDKGILSDLLSSTSKLLSHNKSEILPHTGKDLTNFFQEVLKENILSPSDVSPEVIKRIIDNSGVMFESKLQKLVLGTLSTEEFTKEAKTDLKLVLYEVLSSIKHNDNIVRENKGGQKESVTNVIENTGRAELFGKIKEIISTIEIDQISNHIAKKNTDCCIFQIPYNDEEGNGTARLYVYGNKKNKNSTLKNEKGSLSLALFLSMKYLGDVRADVFIDKKTVHSKFTVSKKKAFEKITQHAQNLTNQLLSAGFFATVRVEEKKDVMKTETQFIDQFNFVGENMVDVHI